MNNNFGGGGGNNGFGGGSSQQRGMQQSQNQDPDFNYGMQRSTDRQQQLRGHEYVGSSWSNGNTRQFSSDPDKPYGGPNFSARNEKLDDGPRFGQKILGKPRSYMSNGEYEYSNYVESQYYDGMGASQETMNMQGQRNRPVDPGSYTQYPSAARKQRGYSYYDTPWYHGRNSGQAMYSPTAPGPIFSGRTQVGQNRLGFLAGGSGPAPSDGYGYGKVVSGYPQSWGGQQQQQQYGMQDSFGGQENNNWGGQQNSFGGQEQNSFGGQQSFQGQQNRVGW